MPDPLLLQWVDNKPPSDVGLPTLKDHKRVYARNIFLFCGGLMMVLVNDLLHHNRSFLPPGIGFSILVWLTPHWICCWVPQTSFHICIAPAATITQYIACKSDRSLPNGGVVFLRLEPIKPCVTTHRKLHQIWHGVGSIFSIDNCQMTFASMDHLSYSPMSRGHLPYTSGYWRDIRFC